MQKVSLVKDLVDLGIDASGVDISDYAIENSMVDIKNRLFLASADNLPFQDMSFDAVISINTIHNLEKERCKKSIKEMQRVSKNQKNLFIQVDSYNNEKQKKIFESWVLTAKFYGYPQEWLELFKECNYNGDYFWTIIE